MIDSKKSMKNDWIVYKLKLYTGYIYCDAKETDHWMCLGGIDPVRELIKKGLSRNEAERFSDICRKLTRN